MSELKERLLALGLSEDMADEVIRVVADYVKSKLPADYQGVVDELLAGQIPDLGPLAGMLGGLKGLFGK